MIRPDNCPYKGLTAAPCWRCSHHNSDTDECALNSFAKQTATATIYKYTAQTYQERLKSYEKQREELMKLSKEALVDLILHRPTY